MKEAQAKEMLSLEEVNDRYFGEWVLLRVLELNEYGDILRAEVLEHNRSRAAISRAVKKADRADPTCHLSVFLGGTRRVSGDELREVLARVAKEEYVNARW